VQARITSAVPTTGPASCWAQPLTCRGVDNFFRVSPTLYRGQQPTAEGFKNLSKMGIKMVISLRKFHGDSGKIGDLPLKYKRITFNTLHPEDKEVVEFLKLVSDPANQPVFVHCKHGSDRTGMMCAVYRVVFGGWTKDQAIDEWTKGGFGFHSVFKHLVKYFRKTDLKSLAPVRPTSRPAGSDRTQSSLPMLLCAPSA
jgi:protein tyrosine/serine phosphatase